MTIYPYKHHTGTITMADTGKKKQGFSIQDEDGNVYLLRPELLELTKEPQLKGKPRSEPGIRRIIITKELDPEVDKKIREMRPPSTVMCAGCCCS